MNKLNFTTLAQRLASNSNYIAEEEEATLRELLAIHSQGMLEPDLIEEIEQLIQKNPLAASIWKEFQASEENLKTEAEKAWLENSRRDFMTKIRATRTSQADEERAAAHVQAPPLSAFFAALRDSISDIFASHASLVTASGREGMERTLDDGKTRIFLKPDSAGRQWLHVTSVRSELAGQRIRLEVEQIPAMLTFSEVAPGVYDARVCVSDELAAALAGGSVKLKLPPISPS